MEYEITIKIKVNTSEIIAPTDTGFRDRIQEDVIDNLSDADLDFQSEDDMDVKCWFTSGEITDLNQNL